MNSLSWLAVLLGFFLPLALFLVAFVFYKGKPGALLLVASITSFFSILAVVKVAFSSPYWERGTQVIWAGVTASGVPLIIGGEREDAAAAWPQYARAPQITVTPGQASGTGALEISRGGAFVVNTADGQALNGTPLAEGRTARFGDFHLRVNRLGLSLNPFTPEVEVLDGAGKSLAGFSLRPGRVRSLRHLVAGQLTSGIDESQSDQEREQLITTSDKLEEWAATVWLLRTDNKKVQVLTQDDAKTLTVKTPAELTVRWPNLSLPIVVDAGRNIDGKSGASLAFSSPWRLASPLPPASIRGCEPRQGTGDLTLSVTSRPRPCESSLLLPFGPRLGEFNHQVSISPQTNKLTSPPATDNEVQPECPPTVECKKAGVGTSQITLGEGPYSFKLATVRNLPSRTGIMSLLGLGWVLFVGGLILAHPRMPEAARGVVYALALVAWNFLAFRLLLSLRYALDPAALDKLAISGVTRAFFGFMVVPGLLLLVARLRCDRYERPVRDDLRRGAMLKALLYVGVLLLATLAALYLPSRLWSDLPAQYYASPADYLLSFGGLIFLAAVVLVAFHIKFLYQPDPKGILVRLFVSPWYLPESYFTNQGRRFWDLHLSRPWGRLLVYFVAGAGFFFAYVVLFIAAQVTGVGDKTAQELSVPIFFCWVSLLWLALVRHVARHRHTFTWKSYAVLTLSSVLMLAGPAVAIPFGMRDFGSILPVLALLLPLTWLLVVTLPWRAALCVALAVVAIFVSGLTFYQNLEGTIPLQKQFADFIPDTLARSQGRTFARLLNYKRGSSALRLAVTANSIVGSEGLPYQELLNGNQHTWENRSIAHLGGMWGVGFGEAPTRRSRVRQDTLQYDSVYSFFVTSEYGLAGGVLLLLLYAVPLAALFIGGRRRFDAGYALAFIVASAFLIEALYHAGMNVGAFPLTGRNLPLLSVNSPSDLLRWTLLFALMVTAVFWRYEGQQQIKDEAESLIEPPPAPPPTGPGVPPPAAPRDERLPKYALVFFFVPAFFAVAVLSSGVGVLRDTEKNLSKYTHEPILKDIKWYLDKRFIEYDDQAKRLTLRPQDLKDADVKSFIQQEVDRFNAREQVEREEGFAKEYVTRINALLSNARNLEQFNAALGAINQLEPPENRQSVFSTKIEVDEDGEPSVTRIEPNQGFDVSFSFEQGLSELRVPNVVYGDEVLIGPAWVSGRFRSVIKPGARLPWVAYLRNALLDESARLGEDAPADAVSKKYGRLTLDKALHEAALDFTAAKGVGLHESFLADRELKPEDAGKPAAFVRKLPPRVALSILSLPSGEALALGGWPTMSSERPEWTLARVRAGEAEKNYWVPPVSWIEHGAPKAFRLRYGGDRNFDRTLVMGSTIKPIWAAAVLRMHPGLDGQLKVLGGSGSENDAFGLRVAGRKPWMLNSRPAGQWVDFTHYLKTSDNRYHVRLGLLGLAENDGGRVRPAGPSPSRFESLSEGEPRPWERYPAFTRPLRVDNLALLNFKEETDGNGPLAGTNFAKTLRGMFSIGVAGHRDRQDRRVGEFGFRRSFWTKDEADDLTASPRRASELFNQISPEAVDFAFDELTRPRDYITMLLGGGNNMWANVDLAAAFGTCLTGRPVVAHIVSNGDPLRPLPERQLLDPAVASKLHAGLEAVTSEKGGTAFNAMNKGALALLKSWGVKAYAKTGTLRAEDEDAPTSRIVLALVKWKDEKAGEVETGLVFSLVVEEGRTGTAAEWLAQFIVEHKSEIHRLLQQKQQQ